MRWSYRTKTKGVKTTKARGVNLGIDKAGQVHAPETRKRNNELKTQILPLVFALTGMFIIAFWD